LLFGAFLRFFAPLSLHSEAREKDLIFEGVEGGDWMMLWEGLAPSTLFVMSETLFGSLERDRDVIVQG